MKRVGFWLFGLAFVCSNAHAQAPYYQGKTIRVVVGYPAGTAMTCGRE